MKLWKVISGCVLKAGYGRKSKLVIVKGCIWPLKVKLGVHWWRGEISTGLGELPMGRWLPYSTCQSCTWQRECQDGAAHCSHSWVTPWPWIYIFPVHWENTQTHKSCHKWRQRRKVAPEVQVELLSSKLCTPDKGFQKSNLNSWPNNQTVQMKQYLEHTDLVQAVQSKKSCLGFGTQADT